MRVENGWCSKIRNWKKIVQWKSAELGFTWRNGFYFIFYSVEYILTQPPKANCCVEVDRIG